MITEIFIFLFKHQSPSKHPTAYPILFCKKCEALRRHGGLDDVGVLPAGFA
jgi:hypothetical protein